VFPQHVEFRTRVPAAWKRRSRSLRFGRRSAEGCTWSVAGFGKRQLPMAMAAIAMGGHVRVGLEDNLFYSRGRLARMTSSWRASLVSLRRPAGSSLRPTRPEGPRSADAAITPPIVHLRRAPDAPVKFRCCWRSPSSFTASSTTCRVDPLRLTCRILISRRRISRVSNTILDSISRFRSNTSSGSAHFGRRHGVLHEQTPSPFSSADRALSRDGLAMGASLFIAIAVGITAGIVSACIVTRPSITRSRRLRFFGQSMPVFCSR